MCCATRDVITPRLAKAKPSWKCNESLTVSNKPLCPRPNLPLGGVMTLRIRRIL
jgi:hypothetical protein